MERIPRLVSRCREKSPAPTLRAIDPRGVLGFKAVCAKRSAATATLFAQGTTITMESSLQQTLRRLPFAFAKRHGVLLDGTEKMTPQTDRDIYIEGGRIGVVSEPGAGSTFTSFSGSAPVANAACAATDSANATATVPKTLHSIDMSQP